MKGPSWPFGINFRQWHYAMSAMLAEMATTRSAKLAARLIAGKTLNNGLLIVFTHDKRMVSAPDPKIKVAEETSKAGAVIKTFKETIDKNGMKSSYPCLLGFCPTKPMLNRSWSSPTPLYGPLTYVRC